MVLIKTKTEIQAMREAGRIVATVLKELEQLIKPGVSTFELDAYSEARCREMGSKPAFKGYQKFPGSLCVSVNEEVVHGIPSRKKILKEGDIIGCDFGVILDGWYGDSARTYPVGKISAESMKLIEVTEKSLFKGIEQCVAGNALFDIGHAVQNYVEQHGFSVVREFVGHGIGRSLHEDPQVPNFGPKGRGIKLVPGMVLAIEPMINQGRAEVRVLQDGWTAVTVDKKLSAHFEHTVAILENSYEILSLI